MTSMHNKTGPQCQTMIDVRREVDRLDQALVKLMAERQTYMEAAARIKQNRDAVYDRPRIEDVVGKVLQHAKAQGLSADIAEPVWRELIDRSIAYEYQAWDMGTGDQ